MTKKINCPQCQKTIKWDTNNPHRPFCSERCKLLDLGAWASESYQIPTQPRAEDYSTGMDTSEQPFTPTRH